MGNKLCGIKVVFIHETAFMESRLVTNFFISSNFQIHTITGSSPSKGVVQCTPQSFNTLK